ncbi:hypothetical protein [Halomonas sp. WWR20]
MKRAIGMAVANWLRKPENRQKAKRTAQKFWNKRKGPGDNNNPGNHNP